MLSTRALNRAVLARQGLLKRADADIPQVLQQMGFLQAQYAPSMYIGLWSRLAGFQREQLTRALEERRVVQGTLLRSTIHLVAADDYWPVALAVRDTRRSWYERVTKGSPGTAALQGAADRLRQALTERETVSQRELDDLVGRDVRSGVGLWIDLVRVPPAGTWERRRANLYAAAEHWLGPPPAELVADPQRCVDLVVRRYLSGFGPAAAGSVADWAGLPVTTVRAALERMPLRGFHREDGTEVVDLPGQPLPGPGTAAPVRYLPTWDATLLAHCRHAGVLSERYRPVIFTTKSPQSYGTFLVDGSVAGTWRYDDGRVLRHELSPLALRVRAQLDAEGERLADLHR